MHYLLSLARCSAMVRVQQSHAYCISSICSKAVFIVSRDTVIGSPAVPSQWRSGHFLSRRRCVPSRSDHCCEYWNAMAVFSLPKCDYIYDVTTDELPDWTMVMLSCDVMTGELSYWLMCLMPWSKYKNAILLDNQRCCDPVMTAKKTFVIGSSILSWSYETKERLSFNGNIG